MRKNALFLTLSVLVLNLTFCSNDEALSGVEQKFTTSTSNNITLNAEDPEIDDNNVSAGESFNGPEPTEPNNSAPGDSNDTDGDGIPNNEDHFPDVCTKIVVTSDGVSSARITLNDEELYSPSDFHNKDVKYAAFVNLEEGDNTIFIRLAGSPRDALNVRFYNCTADPVDLLFETTVTRTAGSPNTN